MTVLHNGPVPPLEGGKNNTPPTKFGQRVQSLASQCAGDIATETSGGMFTVFIDPSTKKMHRHSNFMGSGEELHEILRQMVALVNGLLVEKRATYHYHLSVASTDKNVLPGS